ncbi:MAG: DUF7005 family protein [Ruminiclostridium sp.]
MSVISELAKRFPQLYIKPEKGASRSDLYRGIVRCGEQYSGELTHFIGSDEDSLTIAETPAGTVEMVFLKNREDFECFYQIIADKCEPVPVLRSVGAAYIGGINDWSKIHAHMAEYEKNGGTDTDSEFRRFTADKGNYKTSMILLSDGFYSNISYDETPYGKEEWLRISLEIRKYHELTHFVCRHFFPGNIKPIWDELLADFYGLLCATGRYEPAMALKFLGIHSGKYTTGRLERYVEGQISGELVDEIVELTELLAGLAPERFSKEEDNFSAVISIQENSAEILKKFPSVN